MRHLVASIILLGPLVLAGCTGTATNQPKKQVDEKDPIRAELDKLDPADRKLAAAQRWCAVQNKNRLGDMGVPVKVMVDGQPVFLCCDHCQKQALADPEKTLATVERLKAKAAETAP